VRNREHRLLAGAAAIPLRGGLGVACSVWSESQKAATLACVSSLHAGLLSIDGSDLALRKAPGKDWSVLADSEVDRLISLAAKRRSLDCRTEPGQPLADLWNSRLQISVKFSRQDRLHSRCTQKGPIRSRTSDDLVSVSSCRVTGGSRHTSSYHDGRRGMWLAGSAGRSGLVTHRHR